MAQLFVLLQDGRPIQKGLTRAKAEAMADYLQRNMERKVAGTSIRVPAYEIQPDRDLAALDNVLYQTWKETR